MKSTDVKDIYDESYFLEMVDGFKEFGEFDGSYNTLFPRYKRNIELLGLKPSERLLELGCGRGEICIYHSMQGGEAVGVDFSADAIKLAESKCRALGANATFIESSFEQLNLSENSFDKILASEFIEHISKKEGEIFFKKVFSLLKPDGKLLIYTFPNTLQRRYGYPLQRFFSYLKRKPLPKIQDDMQGEHYRLYHLNEQNYFSLIRQAKFCGFKKVVAGYDRERSKTLRKELIMTTLAKTPLRHIFLNNLYLLAEK